MALYCLLLLSRCLKHHQKALAVNTVVVAFLIAYTLIGGYIFLHFEHTYAKFVKMNDTLAKKECIEALLSRDRDLRVSREADFARVIAETCLTEPRSDPRLEWSFKTASLYGFGILTTLGYGKVEPRTPNGRIFTVIYGFIGIPVTVILLTNLGRYLERLTQKARRMCSRPDSDSESINGTTLFFIMILYLLLGAFFIPLLHGQLDFFNGIYFAFICLTAIEYGDLVPDNNWYIPIVIVYVCIGLAISTIALDIGSYYVRKLHYIGQKLKNIANIRIWFGSRDLQVKELITAVGQNIGIGDQIMADIDLETLVHTAIQVKLGRLSRVPQTHMIVEGIWPPELVPLFLKDGQFPLFVDSEDDLLDMTPKKTVVRFQDEVISDIDDQTTTASNRQSSRLSPVPQRKKEQEVQPQKSPPSPTSQTGSDVSQSLQDTTVDTFVMSSE
uniref:Potassium channel subfamily K member 1 n=1 Tax=Haemonchus contortus TaxID=6289 RepID=A0A7I5E6D9_HAECO|nr:Ion transport 2 domain containing protein [Haemonchus contortus]